MGESSLEQPVASGQAEIEMHYSVIVPVRNAAGSIGATLDAIWSQILAVDVPGEVVVVDDASTDGTATVIDRWALGKGNGCTTVRRVVQGGPNASRNSGVSVSHGRWLIFIDGDDRPDAGWLAAMLTPPLTADVIVGGAYAIALPHGRADVVPPASRWAFGYDYAVGGNLAVCRTLVDAIGGFDEAIRAGGTDVDFCVRAQVLAGARVRHQSAAVVEHRVAYGRWSRARVFFRREQGHAYLRRRFALLPSVASPTRADQKARRTRLSTTSVRERAERAGGLTYVVAEVAGRTAGRVVYSWSIRRRPPAPIIPSTTVQRGRIRR